MPRNHSYKEISDIGLILHKYLCTQQCDFEVHSSFPSPYEIDIPDCFIVDETNSRKSTLKKEFKWEFGGRKSKPQIVDGVGNVVFQYGKTNPMDWRVRRSVLISDYIANTKKIYFVEVDKTQEEKERFSEPVTQDTQVILTPGETQLLMQSLSPVTSDILSAEQQYSIPSSPAINASAFESSSSSPDIHKRRKMESNEFEADAFQGATKVEGSLDVTGFIRTKRIFETSDISEKVDIKDIADEESVAKISKLHGKTYKLKSNMEASMGLIADEVEQIVPEAVHKDPSSGKRFVNYTSLIALIIGCIHWLMNLLGNLIPRVSSQEAKIAQMQTQLNVVHKKVNSFSSRAEKQQEKIDKLHSKLKEKKQVAKWLKLQLKETKKNEKFQKARDFPKESSIVTLKSQ